MKDKVKNSILVFDEEKTELPKEETSLDVFSEKPNKMAKRVIIIVIAILILCIILFAIVTIINLTSQKIFQHITIGGIAVGKLTPEQATQKIEEEVYKKLNTELTLKQEDVELKVTPEQIEGNYNIEKAVNQAYSIGRYGNIFSNNFGMLKLLVKGIDIPIEFSYNEEKLQNILEEINSKFPQLEDSSYKVENGKLIIKKGHKGIEAKTDIIQEVLKNIQSGENKIIEIPVKVLLPAGIDIEKIYEEIHKEPKDAYYTSEPFEIHEHEEGVDFKISLEEAKSMLQEEKDEYIIELVYTKPKITTDKIGSEAFPDLLSSFSTTYITSKVNRTTNLKLASNQINGVVVMPGETFSYNKVVGPRTAERGFKEAGIYSGGEVVDGLGGGICQISSTLYNIVVLANLEIVQRENHQFLPGYVGAGRDATVVYGSIDFKFKNTRDYPVKIESSVGGGYVRMKLYGKKQENEYDVSFQTKILQTIYPKTVYKDTTSLKEGKTKVQDSGQNGCKSETYKVVKQNGKVVSTTLLSKDTYSAMNKVVLRGTKKTASQTSQQNNSSSNNSGNNEVPKDTNENQTYNNQTNSNQTNGNETE